MSDISLEIKENTIKIKQTSESEVIAAWTKPIHELIYGETEDTDIFVDRKDRFKIFLWENIGENFLLIYSKATQIKCYYTSENGAYLRLLDKSSKILSVSLNRAYLTIQWFGSIRNKFHFDVSNCKLMIDENTFIEFEMPVSKKRLTEEDIEKKQYRKTFKFKTKTLVHENVKINNPIHVVMQVNGKEVRFNLKTEDLEIEDLRDYYTPFASLFYRKYALHMRYTSTGVLTLVRRPKAPEEETFMFQIMENPIVSKWLYELGRKYKRSNKKKINLFYEKFAEKAEEGTYEVFLEALKSKNSESYFILDRHTEDYEKNKHQRHLVKKYSFQYYWLLYKVSSYISTESPIHVNIIRSNNRYFRKSIHEANFIFLQHGIIYLKNLGRTSPFSIGREGEPTYIMVSSEKEKMVVSEMLGLPEERIIKAGIPIYSKIEYKHFNQESKDIVAIMLTWKPYEEYLTDFGQSSYYQNIIKISEILHKKLSKENVIIVAHPKVKEQLENTEFGKNIWKEPISEALKIAKLLITDYSSVCYNSFYQGAGVVFFHEDLELYEEKSGKLVPNEDEYIGHRVFSLQELQEVLEDGISDGRIMLHKFRTEEFEERYKTINEFNDGKNTQRICEELKKMNII